MQQRSNSEYHIYYTSASSANSNPRDHFIKDDKALCSYGVNTPNQEKLKSIDEMSKEEWALILSHKGEACGECLKYADSEGIIPEEVPDEPPKYLCPECGEEPDEVILGYGSFVRHNSIGSGQSTTHDIPPDHFEQWRRNPTQ